MVDSGVVSVGLKSVMDSVSFVAFVTVQSQVLCSVPFIFDATAVTLCLPARAVLFEYESEAPVAVSTSVPLISHLISASWLSVTSKFTVSPVVDSGVVSSGL